MDEFVIKVERAIYRLTGIILPTLRDKFAWDAWNIQLDLNDEHDTRFGYVVNPDTHEVIYRRRWRNYGYFARDPEM